MSNFKGVIYRKDKLLLLILTSCVFSILFKCDKMSEKNKILSVV